MTYCIRGDIDKRLRPDVLILLTDKKNTGVVDYGLVDSACQEASDEIDGYVGSRYQLPLSSAPGRLRSVAVDIAVYRLYLGRGWTDQEAEVSVVTAYKGALQFLRDVANGVASLGIPLPQQAAADAGAFEANPRLFSRDTLKGM